MSEFSFPSTGVPSLDEVVTHLRLGDNIVWQVDDVEDYKHFVLPYVKKAIEEKRNIIYLRFASHPPLLEPSPDVKVFELDAASGFESFSTEVHRIIT
jgi:pyruvate,water dikinase